MHSLSLNDNLLGERGQVAPADQEKPVASTGGSGISLANRLFILAAIAFLPALLILGHNVIDLRQSRELEVRELALRNAKDARLQIERILEGVEHVLWAVSAIPEVREMEFVSCRSYLREIQTRMPHLKTLSVIDLTGRLGCQFEMPLDEQRYNTRSYFRDALAMNRFTVGTVSNGRGVDQSVLPLAVPLRRPSGAPAGVLVAGLDLNWLGERLRERDLARGALFTVADREGTVLFREPAGPQGVGTALPEPLQRLVRGDQAGVALTDDGSVRRVTGYIPASLTGGVYVSSALSYDKAFGAIDRTTRGGVLIILAGLLVALMGAWIAGRFFVQRPVATILETVAAWRSGSRQIRTGMRAQNGEIEAVGEAFDHLLGEIAQAESRNNLLVNELNHRVKNTLAMVQSLAAQTLKTSPSLAEFKRTFNARLLSLSQTQTLLTQTSWEHASMIELLLKELRPYGEERVSLLGADVDIAPNFAVPLGMVFHELATNAAKYGALTSPEGRVCVSWGLSDSKLKLEWREQNGPPVSMPTRRGFGSSLLERAVSGQLGGTYKQIFAADGFVCQLQFAA